MEEKRLEGKNVAILVASGFEELQMTDTQKQLIAEGAVATPMSSEPGLVNGWHEGTWGHNFYIEADVSKALPSQYDALVVPGGTRSIAKLSENAHARRIVKGMIEAGKPVGILGEGPGLLIAAEAASGRTVTGTPETQEALTTAGATWGEGQAIVDGTLVSSAGGEDLPAFIDTLFGLLADASQDDDVSEEQEQAA